jgi:hypothetical protein
MDQRLAEAVGDAMLVLHTRTRDEPAPLLDMAIIRFARHFAEVGVSKRATLQVLQGLIDQAVAAGDLTLLRIVQIADELQCRVPALCAHAYDAFHPTTAHSCSMEISFGFEAGILTVRVAGQYPPEDAKTALEAVLPGAAQPEILGTLIDLRDSASIDTRARGEMESFGEFLASLRGQLGGRLAIVVRSDVAYSLTRVAAVWAGAEGLLVHIDRNERRALAWLRQ